MRTIPYSHVLSEASELWSGEASVAAPNAAILNRHIRKRATQFWEMFYWPEWTNVEERQFRPTWDGTATYKQQDQVYWPQTRAYYMSVQNANSNNQPTLTAPNPCGPNPQWWVLLQGDYSELPQYDPTAAYALASQVQWSFTQEPYVCFQATPGGIDPSNAAYWCPLTEFLRNITLTQAWEANTIAETRRVYDLNPWIHNQACELPFIVSGTNGLIIRGREPVVWVEFRLQAPSWAGAPWTSTATFAAGGQTYFSNGSSSDYYAATGNVAAGQSPLTNPALWSVIGFPYVFREAAAWAAYADMLRVDGQGDRAGQELNEATRLLRLEFDKLERQQGQTRPLKVVNRSNANAAW